MEGSYLEELVKNSRKMLFYARIRTAAVLVVAVGIIYCGIVVLPSVLGTVQKANEVMAQASDTITLADTAIESITEMSKSITDMGDNMDAFITDNANSVEEIMKKIGTVDFDGLNKAIKDLGDTVEPFAKFLEGSSKGCQVWKFLKRKESGI